MYRTHDAVLRFQASNHSNIVWHQYVLGKRLVVVDLYSDAAVVSIRLPAPAWSCAWGGWNHPPRADVAAVCAPSSSSSDPAVDPNLVSVGLANGEVHMYDLRRTDTCVARIKFGGTMRSAPVHSVVPVSPGTGVGLLLGTLAGAYSWRHRSPDNSPGGGDTGGGSGGGAGASFSRGALDLDGMGWITPLSHVPSGACTSLSWAPGSMTVAVSLRGVSGGGSGFGVQGGAGGGSSMSSSVPIPISIPADDGVGGHGGGSGFSGEAGGPAMSPIDPAPARNVILRSTRVASLDDGGGEVGGGTNHLNGLGSSQSEGWGTHNEVSVAIGHDNAAVMSRVALLRPSVAGKPTFIAGGDEKHNCVAVWRARDGCLLQRLPPHIGGATAGGIGASSSGGEVFDVRSWCGDGRGGGGDEVLASLSRDSLQLCTWHAGGGGC